MNLDFVAVGPVDNLLHLDYYNLVEALWGALLAFVVASAVQD